MSHQKLTHFCPSDNETGNANKKPHVLFSYLATPEVARELGVDESYVRDLIHGKIKGVPRLVAAKCGRKYFVSVFSLMFWARPQEGWADEKARLEAEKATRNCKFTAEQILAGNVEELGWPTPQQIILGAIPNFKN